MKQSLLKKIIIETMVVVRTEKEVVFLQEPEAKESSICFWNNKKSQLHSGLAFSFDHLDWKCETASEMPIITTMTPNT